MIKFSIQKLIVKYVRVTSISEALGGSIRIVDETLTDLEGKIVTTRHELPYSVARAFKKVKKGGNYLVPINVAVTYYGDQIIHIEERPCNLVLPEGVNWRSASEFTINTRLTELTSVDPHLWYIDMHTIYKVPANFKKAEAHQKLTEDGKFVSVAVESYPLKNLHMTNLFDLSTGRTMVAFIPKVGSPVFTAPIWKNVNTIRTGEAVDEDESKKPVHQVSKDQSQKFRFDVMDDSHAVNLEFVISAAKTMGEHFGYDHIAPLNLDRLMIELSTVNLPNVRKSVRNTYDTGLRFKVTMAWLIGYVPKCKTITQYCEIRGLMKQLCTTGVMDLKSIRTVNSTPAPQMIDRDDAYQHVVTNFDRTFLSGYMYNKLTPSTSKSNLTTNTIGAAD